MSRCSLTDREWAASQPLLPNRPRGVPEDYGPYATGCNR